MAADTQALIRVADLPDVRILLDELDARRAAMKHADDFGIDVAAVVDLICPPPCQTCKGTGVRDALVPRWCPACRGRSQHTLHDRVDSVVRLLDGDYESVLDVPNAIEALRAIVADLAKPGVTP